MLSDTQNNIYNALALFQINGNSSSTKKSTATETNGKTEPASTPKPKVNIATGVLLCENMTTLYYPVKNYISK